MYLETSQDILFVALAISVVVFTTFLCWLLYQAIRFVRNANNIVENVSQKLEMIVEAVEFIRNKVDKMTSSMGIVSKIASTLVEKFILGSLGSEFDEMVDEEPPKKKTTRKRRTTKKK